MASTGRTTAPAAPCRTALRRRTCNAWWMACLRLNHPSPSQTSRRANSAWNSTSAECSQRLRRLSRKLALQRELHFGGYYARGGPDSDETYTSIAVPILVDERVIGCVNLTWIARSATASEIATRHLADLKSAAAAIAARMRAAE